MRQPVVIYTGAVYGAFKKDRGADIKAGLFMEDSDTWAVVCMHTIECVSLGQRGGSMGVVCVSAWVLVYRFYGVTLRRAPSDTCSAATCDSCLSVCVEYTCHVRTFSSVFNQNYL